MLMEVISQQKLLLTSKEMWSIHQTKNETNKAFLCFYTNPSVLKWEWRDPRISWTDKSGIERNRKWSREWKLDCVVTPCDSTRIFGGTTRKTTTLQVGSLNEWENFSLKLCQHNSGKSEGILLLFLAYLRYRRWLIHSHHWRHWKEEWPPKRTPE